MNLIGGNVLDRARSLEELVRLGESICVTLEGGELPLDRVIDACDRLAMRLSVTEHLPLLLSLGMEPEKALRELNEIKTFLSSAFMHHRLNIEFGDGFEEPIQFVPYASKHAVRQAWKPLGTLLHIAAGNVDALPALSIIEGLLTGNINILKLPEADDGLTILILLELIKEEPLIAEYVYVFDYSSSEVELIRMLAQVADAIVVWGGDEAVKSVRSLAHPNTRIIEWGHKISFAYVSGKDISDDALAGIAYNMCDTQQLFCNSCQGIYLDCDSMQELMAFSQRFLRIFDDVAGAMPAPLDTYLQAQKTLEILTEKLESAGQNKHVLQTERCSVIAYEDDALAPSHMFQNCWIKRLPQARIIRTLRPYKNHLQTVALLCNETQREALETIFSKLSVVRITGGRNMSVSYCGIPHDGEFSLRRYMKRLSIEHVNGKG